MVFERAHIRFHRGGAEDADDDEDAVDGIHHGVVNDAENGAEGVGGWRNDERVTQRSQRPQRNDDGISPRRLRGDFYGNFVFA